MYDAKTIWPDVALTHSRRNGTRAWDNQASPPRLPSQIFGIHTLSMKRISLILLVVQNSALIVTMHYSRIVPVESGYRYVPSTAVLLVEIIKLVVSLSIATFEMAKAHPTSSPRDLVVLLRNSFFSSDSWKLIIPAALYTLQNSLIYVAISNLEAVTFQVTYQLKILTTVLFSIRLLGKTISSQQWLALVLLTLGVAIVQTSGPLSATLPSFEEMKSTLTTLLSSAPSDLAPLASKPSFLPGQPDAAHLLHSPTMSATRGLLAVLAASLISGLTCVYFELIVKSTISSVSLWTRNVQLSFYSLFLALFLGVIYQDGPAISAHGFFAGYNSVVWAVIALQALGGLVVAVVITSADNVAKNFAASVSIVVSCVASAVFFGTGFSVHFTLGTAIVLLAVYLYNSYSRASLAGELLLPISKERDIQG